MNGVIDQALAYTANQIGKSDSSWKSVYSNYCRIKKKNNIVFVKGTVLRLWTDSRAVQSNHNTPRRIQAGRGYILHSRSNGRKCGNIRKDRDGRSLISVHKHSDKLLDLFIQLPTVALPEGRCA